MNGERLTPWFPASVKPARVGVYEVMSMRNRAFAYWNGDHFCWRCWEAPGCISEKEAVCDAFRLRNEATCLSEREVWRGLSEQPK